MHNKKIEVNVKINTPSATDIAIAQRNEVYKEFNAYMNHLQSNFSNIIKELCLHQGYLITTIAEFLYAKTNNDTMINAKKLALEIKENMDTVRQIREIDYNKKEYFANSLRKLSSFIKKTENSIYFNYYHILSYKKKCDLFLKIASFSFVLSALLGLFIYIELESIPAKIYSKYHSSIDLFNKLQYLFSDHQIIVYAFILLFALFVIFSVVLFKARKNLKLYKSHLIAKALSYR